MKQTLLSLILLLTFASLTRAQTSGLKAYYPFSADANDYSGNAYNATLSGTPVFSNYLLLGDNTADLVTVPTAVMDNLFLFTLSFKINFTAFHFAGSSPTNHIITGDRISLTSAFAFSYNKSLSEWDLVIENDHFSFPDSSIMPEQWYCVTITRDSSQKVHLFVDGVLNAYEPVCSYGIDIDTLLIGQEHDCFAGCFAQNQCLHGRIGEVRVYNRPLRNSEVQLGCISPFSGIFDIKNKAKSFIVYPNPVADRLYFSAKSPDATIDVINCLGQTVLAFAVVVQPTSSIDVSTLPAGVYFIRQWINSEMVTTRFVKE